MPTVKPRILVVDDSHLTRSFHCYVIREAGFDVASAADGNDGLSILSREHFDAVLTDLEMDGMDGMEFTRRIRENPDRDQVPVIVLSSHARAGDKDGAFAAGANLYLVKPTPGDLIVESIRMVLGARRS